MRQRSTDEKRRAAIKRAYERRMEEDLDERVERIWREKGYEAQMADYYRQPCILRDVCKYGADAPTAPKANRRTNAA